MQTPAACGVFGRRRAAVAALLVLLCLGGCSPGEDKARAGAAPAAVPVVTATVVAKTVPIRIGAVGTVVPVVSVAVKARIDGQLQDVHFKEGDTVRRGQRLFSLDPRALEAQLAQAEANLARDRALLANARRQTGRYSDLLQRHFVSQEAFNQIRTGEDTAQATVEADVAALGNARVQLAYASISSPIDGVAGRILIQRGNMIKANDTDPLVVINQVSPIYVEFSVPEQNLSAIRDARASGPLAVEVATETGGRAAGELSFVDNSVDTATGMIRLRASFPNRDRRLWPGQYVNAGMLLGEERGALVVPAQAVQTGPEGAFVYVVRADATAEARKVQPGRSVGGETVIAKGLAAGETVVTDGQSRLSPGARVQAQGKPAGSAG